MLPLRIVNYYQEYRDTQRSLSMSGLLGITHLHM